MVKLGVIGGSGAKEVAAALGSGTEVKTVSVELSDHSLVSVDFLNFNYGDTEVYFVLRHGKHHSDLLAKLDQRGIFNFLYANGVKDVILTSATGSLDTSVKLVDEGGMVVNSGVMRGFGYKGLSFNYPTNPHAVLANPYHADLRRLLLDSVAAVPNTTAYDGGLYIQSEGNSFESPAEIADLVCRLDTPVARYRELQVWKEQGVEVSTEELALYQRLAQNLNRQHAQVSMNAVRSTILALENSMRVGLVSFPVNYGAGLIPEEKVDHERTMQVIQKAVEPYITPFLKNVIMKAPEYVTK